MEGFAWKAVVSAALIALGVAVLVTPLTNYLMVGWRAKRRDILGCFDPWACQLYFKMYAQDEPLPGAEVAAAEFKKIYNKWYGRHYFTVPVILLVLVGAALVTGIALTGLTKRHFLAANPVVNLPNTALAAAAGAYMWVVNDFISRSRRLDFSPADVLWATLRLTIAIPMGYSFASIVRPEVGPFMAFALGAFPLDALAGILRRLANKKLDIGETDEEGSDRLTKLQGVSKEVAERLAKEDLSTITQLAYCDPVTIAMRSSLSFNSVVDLQSQALAWRHLGDKLNTIRPLGLRGALEICHLVEALTNTEPADSTALAQRQQAEAAFALIAQALGQSPQTLIVVFTEIADDPYTRFLAGVMNCVGS